MDPPDFGADSQFSRDMLIGAICWSVFAAVAIALQGVLVDETAVPAQIISGLVTYPGGHPHDIFYKSAYSFPNVVSAWFLSIWNNDVALSAFRNWLFLSLSILAPFAVTLAITRRLSWANLAAALMLFGGHISYAGVYFIRVFPHFYSHGHMGLQFALLAAALIVGRMRRTGGVLAGMMPALHAGMTLAAWPWLTVYVLWLLKSGEKAAVRRIVAGWAIGVLFCVGVAFLIPAVSDPLPAVATYGSLPGAEAARAGFEAISDDHRDEPTLVSRGYLLGPIAFFALSYILLWATAARERTWTESVADAAAMVGVGVVALGIVYGVWLMQMLFGDLPHALAMAMPYRLSNVAATLLVPMSVAATAAVVRYLNEQDEWVGRAMAALVVAALGLAMSGLLPLSVRNSVEREMLFLLWGLPFGLALWAFGSSAGQRWHALVPAVLTLLAAAAFWTSSKGAIYLFGSIVACLAGAWIARRLVPRIDLGALRRISAAALGFAAIVCVFGVLSARRAEGASPDEAPWMISGDDLTIRRWLTDHATPDEPVLEPIWPRYELQAKARQPVLFESETLWLMTYMPSLAPKIGTMTRDFYGVDYERPDDFTPKCVDGRVRIWCDVWNEAWRTRTREQWMDLARKYRFRLVVASPEVNLDLPVMLQTRRANVYEIPRGTAPEHD